MTADNLALRDQVRATLGSNILGLMDELEAYAKLTIRFERYRFPVSPNAYNQNPTATEVDHNGATIYLYDFDSVDQHGITHELLHIHRYWIEGAPQLVPAQGKDTPGNVRACGDVENALEHLIIVPREAGCGFDSSGFWNAVAKKLWERYPWPDITDLPGRRNNALLGRLGLELVTDKEVLARAADCLRSEGLSDEAERFATRIDQFLGEKPRAVGCAIRFLKAPKGATRLVFVDVRRRQWHSAPIPAH
jgi:hypothetical protein